jgi:PPOX class probable F420-dependent enzyme
MNPQEITAYLAASHIAVVATVNRNGHPHLTPNWYRYDGKVLSLITRTDRLKYRNLQRDPRISVCVYDPPSPRIMSSSPGPRRVTTRTSGTRPVASSSATGQRTRWTAIWRAGKQSHGC